MRDFVRRHSLALVAVVAAGVAVAIVGSLGLALVVGVATLLSGGSVLAATVPFLAAAVALAAVEAAALVGLVWLGARRVAAAARVPTNERVARAIRRVENRSETVASLGVADRFEPDPAERRERLRHQYVTGEIDEREYERRLADLLGDAPDDWAVGDPTDDLGDRLGATRHRGESGRDGDEYDERDRDEGGRGDGERDTDRRTERAE